MDNFSSLLEKIVLKKDLTTKESFAMMREIFSGMLSPAQIGGFLTALRSKGESADEIAGFVRAMRDSMTKVTASATVVVDTCGTGGDGKGTFNISTAAAFVVAGAGIVVAKHGNRSISSQCGSADVLTAAGIKVDMTKETAERCLNEIGITFLFAPLYHPSMKNVAFVRKELGIRTVFNLLGPLANPASANAQVIGVPRKELVPLIAKVLQKVNSGKKFSGIVVHNSGYDEIVLNGKCVCAEIKNGKVRAFEISAKSFGLKRPQSDALKGGTAEENAGALKAILSIDSHPLKDVVIANAALAIYCAGQLSSHQNETLLDAVERAKKSLASGAALEKLNALVERSQRN